MPENTSCSSASTCGRSSCEGCPSKEKTSMLEEMNPHSNIKHVIGVVSGKGGVGKSFVTASLASMMAKAGYKVGILDADITGPSIPKAFGLHTKCRGSEEGILPVSTETGIDVISLNLLLPNETDPVVWRAPVITGTVKQFWKDVIWHNIDYMFVDMPPGTGDVPLTVFQSIPLDGIVVVASPQELVSMIVQKAVKMANMMNVPVLGLVENMSYFSCPDCGKKINVFGESHIDSVAKEYNTRVLAKLPMNPELANLVYNGRIEAFEGEYLDEAAEIIENLVK